MHYVSHCPLAPLPAAVICPDLVPPSGFLPLIGSVALIHPDTVSTVLPLPFVPINTFLNQLFVAEWSTHSLARPGFALRVPAGRAVLNPEPVFWQSLVPKRRRQKRSPLSASWNLDCRASLAQRVRALCFYWSILFSMQSNQGSCCARLREPSAARMGVLLVRGTPVLLPPPCPQPPFPA